MIKRFKNKYIVGIIILILGIIAYISYNRSETYDHKVVICIPVYGQSLALGEEAVRMTNFDSLRSKYDGRIVNENLDYQFGCYNDKKWKRYLKRLFQDHRRSFELSLYSMAELLATELGNDTIICIFPGGLGQTPIYKFTKEYDYIYPIFISDIKNAFENSKERGWEFYVPAICWMQGESDIIDYPETEYKKTLESICKNLNTDIKAITNQKEDVRFICYQSNPLSLAKHFDKNRFNCVETRVCQAFVDLIRDDSLFWASGPTYPYHCVNDYLHIDAVGQQHIGLLEADAVLRILRNEQKTFGVIPTSLTIEDNDVLVSFNVPQPPLVFDTTSVKNIDNYGFSVITKDGRDILTKASIADCSVRLMCSESPIECKVRYAVNGEKKKSGNTYGPRGNLRDSHPLRNWCYQFDIQVR